jgi:DNA helicase II / ATP-dependent DNA helicase PcrA
MSKSWSVYQEAVFADVSEGRGHTVVSACPGSGKSTTIVEALRRVPAGKSVAVFAFNRSIKEEMERKAPKGVEVKTFHSHGLSATKRALRCSVDDTKTKRICVALYGEQGLQGNRPFSYASIAHLVKVAKDVLCDGSTGAMDELVDQFRLDVPENFAEREELVERACRVFAASKDPRYTSVIDFADMCWLPVVLGLRVWQFDYVFVDETQDLCPSQIELVLKTVRPGGRIIAVGDPNQAIYAFRGAGVDTLERLIDRLEAKVLPLSISYRCARAIVALANEAVPEMQPAPEAPEGVVARADSNAMKRDAKPGDMIISRANAPLIGICLGFLKAGKRAAIKGRNVGEGLVKLIEKSGATTIADLQAWICEWVGKECDRLAKKDRDTQEAIDKRDCIDALCEDASTVGEVRARAESLFTEVDAAERITLGSTHRLKGLEADRVWMLSDTYRRDRSAEERNLWFVAVSRAKTELRLVKTAKAAASRE